MKLAYVKNLKDQILTNDNSIAVCPLCGAEYSANLGDYWNCDPETPLTCCNDIVCELMTKHTIYEPVN